MTPIIPPYLKSGDTIALVATARKVSHGEMQSAKRIIQQKGYKVHETSNLYADNHQFAGTDQQRAASLQEALDNPKVQAVLFARGGYGTVRLIELLNFESLKSNPKWLIGFSDLTVLFSHLFKQIGLCSLHAPMAVQFNHDNELHDESSLNKMFDALEGKTLTYSLLEGPMNRTGNAKGNLIGGNLSVIYSILGSSSLIKTDNCILFLEDLDEYLYHIDRMMMNLKRNALLDNLSALIIGGMTDMKDNIIPFGKTAGEIILEHIAEYSYPVYFGFPAGHCKPNMPLRLGIKAIIEGNELILSS
jgi:muramoyltetrapeptide carboxypeptidase